MPFSCRLYSTTKAGAESPSLNAGQSPISSSDVLPVIKVHYSTILRRLFQLAMACNQPSALHCKIGPSILNSNLAALGDECHRMMEEGADYLHLDVMDGHFVPAITFGHQMVQSLRKVIPKNKCWFDMHMMVQDPDKFIKDMADAGADQYVFHVEATQDVEKTIRKVKEAGMKVGVAIKPKTPVEVILPYVEHVDLVLVMTVEPGAGGQKFMDDMMPKVKTLRQRFAELDIEVDGGVSPDTIHHCAEAGANLIVSGTAVVKSESPRDVMDNMREAVRVRIPNWKDVSP